MKSLSLLQFTFPSISWALGPRSMWNWFIEPNFLAKGTKHPISLIMTPHCPGNSLYLGLKKQIYKLHHVNHVHWMFPSMLCSTWSSMPFFIHSHSSQNNFTRRYFTARHSAAKMQFPMSLQRTMEIDYRHQKKELIVDSVQKCFLTYHLNINHCSFV